MTDRLIYGVAAAALLLAACGDTTQPAANGETETVTPAAEDTVEATAPGGAMAALEGNPFAAEWTENFGAPPLDQIREEHFMPAFEAAMADHAAEIDAIATNPEPPTFENTLLAMELAGRDLSRVSAVFGNLTSSASNDELRAIQREVSPMLAGHSASITLNAQLFERIDTLYQNRAALGLTDQQARLLEVTHDNFVRAGAQLSEEQRERYAEIRTELSSLYTQFAQNELGDRELWSLELPQEALDNLPSSMVSAARSAARARDMEGHIITLDRSSVEPFLQTSPDRDLREIAWNGFYERGNNGNEFDNNQLIRDILVLRREQARMLGFESWAHYRTAGTMAETPEAAIDLMEQVWWPARQRALEELADIQAMIDAEGGDFEAEGWDWRYYTERVRAERYDLDPAEVAQYLDLDRMIDAMFYTSERLFGVTFHERHDIPVYHPDVRVWEVHNAGGETIALFYGDFFARPGKRSGAWMSSFRAQNGITGEIPLILNNCNYNKPDEGEPALISFIDASTLFHELGHGLHGILSNTDFPSLAGTAVDRDFVEFPAQILEHWLEQPEILQRFAVHHETGEPMPMELLERVLAASTFNAGFENVEFLNSGFMDMAFHLHEDPASIDVQAFEQEILESRQNLRQIPMRHRSTHFLHSFSGEGYAAGYYSYLWAGVLDNDGFAAFEEAGDIFDPETAQRLYEVFSGGNTRPAMEMYTGFRGREPSVEPLLRNRGLLTEVEG
ncbi:MAG: M3 family metallopeptidase [Oceanicaulis sp.]|uniref:M3 family metallopeptidase n=1 Tax=Glycocaulis sp. TaxID=1969725 RepID=UPI0025C1DFC0|nr:M3 family metallopeptidase [Glycocaulis sp.]MCC5982398.1 M3 family metallopeptidase [Oceanicaulis sp.]MCH8521582.1 M3 family metallopeptidase [Glycocaulis sp.]